MKRLSGRGARLIACTLVSATLAAGTTAAQSFHLYWDTKPFSMDRIKAKLNGPSVLLSHELGASPFTGVARYEGPVPCTAVFIETTTRVTKPLLAPAYVLTAAHCVASLDPNEVLIDRPAGGRGRVVFNDFFDSPHRRVAVRVARIAYLTMKGQDLAVLELEATHADLRVQLIRPWPVSLVTRVAVGDPGWLGAFIEPAHELDPRGDVGIALAGLDRVRGVADRIERGGAVARDRRPGDRLRELLGEQGDDPGDVGRLQALGHPAAAEDVLDQLRRQLGVALDQLVDDMGGGLLRPQLGQRALERPTDRGPGGIDDHCFRHLVSRLLRFGVRGA